MQVTYLILSCVFHDKVEPQSMPWVAGVRPYEQIVFVLTHQIDPPQIACDKCTFSIAIYKCNITTDKLNATTDDRSSVSYFI